jgi:hypothetical protein
MRPRTPGGSSAACCSAGTSLSMRRPRRSSPPPSRPRSRPVDLPGRRAGPGVLPPPAASRCSDTCSCADRETGRLWLAAPYRRVTGAGVRAARAGRLGSTCPAGPGRLPPCWPCGPRAGQPLIGQRPLFGELAVCPDALIPDPRVRPPLAPDRYAYGGNRNGDSADCCKRIPDHARSLGSGEACVTLAAGGRGDQGP